MAMSRPPVLWPAWVYCTRYSDRPSSGSAGRGIIWHLRPVHQIRISAGRLLDGAGDWLVTAAFSWGRPADSFSRPLPATPFYDILLLGAALHLFSPLECSSLECNRAVCQTGPAGCRRRFRYDPCELSALFA
uniref:Uncharacterized protein n=1 Tax=Plectus sambesii TaxID=2011161 RepID=A0A914V4X5_9BILA